MTTQIASQSTTLPIARPWFGPEEVEAVQRVLASGWIAQGNEVAAFERAFASHVGAAHACAVSSCTAALHLALLGLGVSAGDEVITVSHSFIATANAIRYCGATPVFIDIDPMTYNMDPTLIEAAISPRTRAILVVHQLGMPADLSSILTLAAQYHIPVIEDAACAIGSEILWQGQWQRIGRPHGLVSCFSFHPRKLMTTGDGGMLTTHDPDLDRQFRQWRQHGMTIPASLRHGSSQVIYETYTEVGYNYRMTDLQAAIGIVQLQRLPELIRQRRTLAAVYTETLADLRGVTLPYEPPYVQTNWQSYIVRLDDASRQHGVMQALQDRGISTRRGVMCAHLEAPYASAWPAGCLPHSEAAQRHGLILPLFAGMDEHDVLRVVAALDEILA
jgi:dTDP-4-amino-4,6-dideoxygalactose transaminase